jgi:two-component system OmpR family response regulator
MCRKVLIVDDHVDTASTLQEFLSDYGIHADIATSGRKAIATAQKYNYRCLVTDVMLPDIDGINVVKKIHAENSNIAIIFVTAKEIDSVRVSNNLGLQCIVLQKPCRLAEILRNIRKCL